MNIQDAHNETYDEGFDAGYDFCKAEMSAFISKNLRVNLFATRDSIKEAYVYAMDIASNSGNPAQVMTALHTLMNAIADEIDRHGSATK